MSPSRICTARFVYAAGLAVAALLLVAPGSASAQPAINITVGRALNALHAGAAATADDRRTTGGTVDVEQTVAGDRVRLFYTLDAGDYTTPGDWRFYESVGGATWQLRPLRPTGLAVFAGTDVTWRTNGSSWEAANYRALGLFANLEWKPAETRTVRAGYRADVRAFPDMPVLDQVEHEGFWSGLVNLQSRTTLVAEVRAGAKLYEVVDIVAPAASESTPGASTGPGWSRGRGAGAHGLVTSMPRAGSGAVVGGTAGQVTLLARLAQSLTDRTGATVQYSRRNSFGALPTAVVTTPALFFDDGVYDDPFASDAAAARATVKRMFGDGMTVGGSGVWVRKDYRGTVALGADGLPLPGGDLRGDRILQAGASWTMRLTGERTGPVGFELIVDYLYTRHRSNDAFYNYASHGVGFAVSVAY